MTVDHILFLILALATCCGAIAVVISQNVVRMAFWLIVTLASTSGLFFLLHADFVGAAQLMVYVGGTLVLLIFGVMLTASGPHVQIRTSLAEGLLGAVVGAALLFVILSTVVGVDWKRVNDQLALSRAAATETSDGFNAADEGNTGRPLGLSFLGLRPDKDLSSNKGQLSTGYLLPFEIVSVHLLVVLIGAAYLARTKRRIKQPGQELS